MLTPDEIKNQLPNVSKTIGGYDVRNLELIQIKNDNQLIIGEIKAMGPDESSWSTKDAIWHITDGYYASWVGGSENFDIELISEKEYLDKKEEKLKEITQTIGGYPVRNLEIVYDHTNPQNIPLIRGDYYRQDIKDWVINEIWWLDGEHLIESTEYHLNLK